MSVVGNSFRILSVVGTIFFRFVASRLIPFTPSLKVIEVMMLIKITRESVKFIGSIFRRA